MILTICLIAGVILVPVILLSLARWLDLKEKEPDD